ncbi:MAG: hypothetical protein HGB15_05410 [Chlorobaculum sp.]|nr:hypothetical protein [Chlorobaculum sp.]
MHTRKLGVGRNILRVFEIALFFAVSVLGYGLMIKASSFNGKSKSRILTPGLQSPPDITGRNREPGMLPGKPLSANQQTLSASHSGIAHAIKNFYIWTYSAIMTDTRDRSYRFGNAPDRMPLPHNLLQQNPVLLI